MATLGARWRRVQREVLGLNRRNQQYMVRLNPPPLVGLVDHKARTKEILVEHGLPVPETLGRYTRQRELPQLARYVEQHDDFVLKPARGAGGEGVLIVAGRNEGRWHRTGGSAVHAADVVAHAADIIAGAFSLSQSRDEALLEKRLIPDRVLGAFSPGGIPDVRVVVINGVPLMAMLRLPTIASDGRANLHMGGVGVGLDLPTGRAVYAIWNDEEIAVHPDTRQPLSSIRVPFWSDILLMASRSADAIPLGYFGIDVVVDNRFGPAILELNARPGLSIQLANHRGLRPLLARLERRSTVGLSAAARVSLGIEIAEAVG
ncbi:MAG TPA: alpha-L-glutamate ligase-like protein [Candidatus Acidoferrales bacterium]|nr:alpha-L-glutamate ligase-like protein [Candidatus Acidoferrales bacterium]